MWGGRYNPILPVDDPHLANALVKLFRVDALVPLSKGAAVDAFLSAHKHLPWPMTGDGLLVKTMRGNNALTIVDISHPTIRLYEDYFKNIPDPQPGLDLFEWEADDPLADVFLCSYGAFPSPDEAGVDYAALAQNSLLGVRNIIQKGAEMPVPHVGRETIATLNRAYMDRHYLIQNERDWPGFYVGDANNFGDLVNFWNLRAAEIPLVFFDPRYIDRLRGNATDWAATIRQAPSRPHGPQGLIPTLVDQNPCTQSRNPMDMILQGWSASLFHASQQ
jgi:hypothetical protein